MNILLRDPAQLRYLRIVRNLTVKIETHAGGWAVGVLRLPDPCSHSGFVTLIRNGSRARYRVEDIATIEVLPFDQEQPVGPPPD